MPTLTFFPLGNADSCLIDLQSGEKLLLDYGNQGNPEDDNDLRCDLPALLRKDLKKAKRAFFDVVAFSHLDKDHYERATEFFYLEHAEKYQSEDRIKITTLWVPAAVITEEGLEDPEGRAIRAEARYRLKNGKGIRVFSRPEKLRGWLEANGLTVESRKHLITDAGQRVPEFTIAQHGVEFFVHSPFAKRLNDTEVEDRNDDSLVLHMTFLCGTTATKVLFAADTTHEILADIVNITRAKGNAERLQWDMVKLPHHCSYLSLAPETGEDRTTPVPEIAWLYEKQGQERGIIVSPSNPIPEKGSDEDKKPGPPYRQAAAYYRQVLEKLDGEFKVTMEHPKQDAPAPLVIEIGSAKATIRKEQLVGAASVITQRAPRAGR
jgi:hypothetical protein